MAAPIHVIKLKEDMAQGLNLETIKNKYTEFVNRAKSNLAVVQYVDPRIISLTLDFFLL